MKRSPNEARITTTNNVLIRLSSDAAVDQVSGFCGVVVDGLENLPDLTGKSVYVCGDVDAAQGLDDAVRDAARVLEIGDNDQGARRTIDAGMVPILWHGVGVYYRRFFPSNINYFDTITEQHAFQSLTESTKPASAHRSGLYLTPVEQQGEDMHFRLLRCSTNLSGATANFGATDTDIVTALNEEAKYLFEEAAPLNHVLAQIYPNIAATGSKKQTKAAISSHADKTKDMPDNGIMAFCTFYDGLDNLQPMADEPFDFGYKSVSGMTRLEFRLKRTVVPDDSIGLPEKFTVRLYPNSVFFMPLSTNRLYTHAIRPSQLDASQLPTRLGYVVRCSATEAVHSDGNTFLKQSGTLAKLQPPTSEGIADLRKLYAEENKTDAHIDYGHRFGFSMNSGDYKCPTVT